MRTKQILYVVGSLELGGSERHLASIAPGLRSRGWRPAIYCLTHRGILADELERKGVEIIVPPLVATGRSRPVKALALIASAVKLFGCMLRRRPAIAHVFLPMAYLIGGPLAVLARLPVRIMSRRSLNAYMNNHPVLRHIELALHPHMTMLLGNSRAVVAELETECRGRVPVELIYNGLPIAPAAADRNAGGGAGASLVFIIVANLIAYKGHADLFRALATVADRLPQDWKLVCVGRDDGIGNDLTRLAGELGLAGHIQLLGQRQDTADLLAGADIGILSSHEEGFSNAILEGMAAGLPMVVTDVGGNAEAVLDGVTGLVVPPRDPVALGKAMLSLADAARRRDMGRAARKRVEDHFSLDACVERYDRLYRKLCGAGESEA